MFSSATVVPELGFQSAGVWGSRMGNVTDRASARSPFATSYAGTLSSPEPPVNPTEQLPDTTAMKAHSNSKGINDQIMSLLLLRMRGFAATIRVLQAAAIGHKRRVRGSGAHSVLVVEVVVFVVGVCEVLLGAQDCLDAFACALEVFFAPA